MAETDFMALEPAGGFKLADKVNETEIRHEILRLTRRGATAAQVQEALAKREPPVELSEEQIRSRIKKYLEALSREDSLEVEQLRILENDRIDSWQRELEVELQSLGKDETKKKLAILDRMMRLSERRAKMNGLDAPQKIDHTINDGLAALGLDEEHLRRAREAASKAFPNGDDPAIDIPEADVVEVEDEPGPP